MTPPTCNNDTFDGVNAVTCTLHVPAGSKSLYEKARGWRDFYTVVDDATAITSINTHKVVIHSISNGIAIETQKTIPVSIFNLAGQIVYQSSINGNAEINLNQGIYVVKTNDESRKIIVK